MKTVFKKSLALAVCVALCLTAFIGCVTVSASGTATAVIETVNVANGTANADVTVTITPSSDIAGARFDIVADATKVTLGEIAQGEDFSVAVYTPATNTTRIVVLADDATNWLSSVTITLPFTILNPETAGTIAITGGEVKEVADSSETFLATTWTDGAIVVAEPVHEHNFSGAWQSDENNHWKVCPTDSAIGNQAAHTFGDWVTGTPATCTDTGTKSRTCSVCGYVENGTIPTIAHNPGVAVQENLVAATCAVAGSYNEVVRCTECNAIISSTPHVIQATGEHTWGEYSYDENGHSRTCSVCLAVDAGEHDGSPCSVCGYEAPVVACEHTYELDSIVPAYRDDLKVDHTGIITFRCSKCDDVQEEEIAYVNANVLDLPAIGCTSTTQLILNARDARFATGETYVVLTHNFANGAESSTEILDSSTSYVSGTYHRWDIGVKTTNFSDTFGTVLVTKIGGAWRNGATREFSIKDAAESAIDDQAEAIKRVAANLLTMGAKAQLAFNQATDDLANAGLTGDRAAYVTATTPSVLKVTSGEGANFVVDNSQAKTLGKVAFAQPGVVLSDAISLKVNANFRYYAGSMDDLKLKVTYTSFNGAEREAYVTGTLATGTTYTTYAFEIPLIAPDMRQPLTVQVYNGEDAISAEAIYSVESALANSLDSANAATADLIYAVMNYSDAAGSAF